MARVERPSTQQRGRIYVCVSILLRLTLEALASRTGPDMTPSIGLSEMEYDLVFVTLSANLYRGRLQISTCVVRFVPNRPADLRFM